ncbi:hypothetical protein Q2471_26615, partial [Escherichia coli]|nr:hypothetical protein [Escherichia coli]
QFTLTFFLALTEHITGCHLPGVPQYSLSVPLSGIRTHRNNRGSISGLELCQEGFLSPSLTGSVSEQEH